MKAEKQGDEANNGFKAAGAETPPMPAPLPSPVEEEQERDAIEDFIASFAERDDAWKVSVYRQGEARTDSAAKRIFLVTLPVTEELLEHIQEMFGGGDYVLEFRKNGRFKRRAMVSIAGLAEANDDVDEPQPVAPPEPITAELTEQERRINRLETALLAFLERQDEPAPEAPKPRTLSQELRESVAALRAVRELHDEFTPQTRENPTQTIDDDERAMMLLLKDADLRSRVSSRLFDVLKTGEAVKEKHWVETTLDALGKYPALAQRLMNTIERFVPAKPSSTQPPAAPNGSESPPQPSPVASSQTEGESMPDQEEDDDGYSAEEIVNSLIANLATNAPPAESVELVRDLARMFPSEAAKYAPLIYGSVDAIIAELKQVEGSETLLALPHARRWIERLQAAMQAEA